MGRDVGTSPEDVHHVHRRWNVGQAPIHALTEDFRPLGVIDGDGDDVVANPLRVLGDEVRRRPRIFRLDAEDGDAPRPPQDSGDAGGVVDEPIAPVGHGTEGEGSLDRDGAILRLPGRGAR
jgi:hypothetical protein